MIIHKKATSTIMFCFRPKTLVLGLLAVLAVLNLRQEYGFSASSQEAAAAAKSKDDNNKDTSSMLCTQNPYVHKLADPLETIAQRMQDWTAPAAYDAMLQQAQTDPSWNITWNSFEPFRAMTTCAERECIGGRCGSDVSKIACGLSGLREQSSSSSSNNNNNKGCIVYSLGGNNQWEFELDALQKTPCQVHTFDCTGSIDRFKVPEHERLHFHHICIGATDEPAPATCATKSGKYNAWTKCGPTMTLGGVQKKLKHEQIDLYKMDIEGYEVPIFRSWPELTDANALNTKNNGLLASLPMQLLVEIHYKTTFQDLWKPGQTSMWDRFLTPVDLVELQRHLIKMGYAVVERDDNRACKHCTELTLVRMQCPPAQK